MNKYIIVFRNADTETGLNTLRVDANDLASAAAVAWKAGYDIATQYRLEWADPRVQARHAAGPDLSAPTSQGAT